MNLELFDLGDGNIRTGVSADGRSFVVQADLARASGVVDTSKFAASVDATNVGTEIIRTNGKSRTVNVLYKRGVFHVLMVSRKPEAVAFKDRLFDFLEDIERNGGYLAENRTSAQNARFAEMIKYREAQDMLTLATDYVPSSHEALSAFTRIQDLLLRKVTGQHAPEIKATREIVTWKGKRGPTVADRRVAKNYLTAPELRQLSGLGDIIVGELKYRYPEHGYTVAEFWQNVRTVAARY